MALNLQEDEGAQSTHENSSLHQQFTTLVGRFRLNLDLLLCELGGRPLNVAIGKADGDAIDRLPEGIVSFDDRSGAFMAPRACPLCDASFSARPDGLGDPMSAHIQRHIIATPCE